MSEIITEKSWKIAPVGVGRRDYSQNVERYDVEPTLLLFEDFEHLPPAWTRDGSTGYSVTRVADIAWRGGASLRMRTGTDPTGNYAGYFQYFGLVRSMKLLVDVMGRLPLAGGTAFGLDLTRFTGAQGVGFRVLYDIVLEKWRYRIPAAPGDVLVFMDVPGGAQSLAEDVFHHVSLAVDFKTEEYLYMQCNERFFSLAGLKPYINPLEVRPPRAFTWIYGDSDVNPNVDFYIDNVRVAEVI